MKTLLTIFVTASLAAVAVAAPLNHTGTPTKGVAPRFSDAPEAPQPAAMTGRILKLRDSVACKNNAITLRDLVTNPAALTEEEANLEIMKTPVDQDVPMSIVDIAYQLQRYPSLMAVKLRGPRNITIKRLTDMRYIDLAKKLMLQYMRENAPWKGWEVDVVFNPSDEILINRAGAFKRIEVMPFDNTNMIGTVGFRISFYDDNDRLTSRININPVILRKVDAMVVRENRAVGYVLNKSDLKKTPVWIGGDKKGYVTEESECVGKELAKEINSGELLRKSDLLNPVCARRGQVIWVTCVAGGLSVKLAVNALENGRLGDSIRVQNRASNKEFSVELTGPKQGMHRLGS